MIDGYSDNNIFLSPSPTLYPSNYILLYTDALVQKLLPLGFTRAAIRKELIDTNGDLNEAANNLLYQLPDSKARGVLASIKKEEKKFIISSVEV